MSEQSVLSELIQLSLEVGREDRQLAILGEGNTSADAGNGGHPWRQPICQCCRNRATAQPQRKRGKGFGCGVHKTVLCVGEKPSIADGISKHLSSGAFIETRRGAGTPVHEFLGDFKEEKFEKKSEEGNTQVPVYHKYDKNNNESNKEQNNNKGTKIFSNNILFKKN